MFQEGAAKTILSKSIHLAKTANESYKTEHNHTNSCRMAERVHVKQIDRIHKVFFRDFGGQVVVPREKHSSHIGVLWK